MMRCNAKPLTLEQVMNGQVGLDDVGFVLNCMMSIAQASILNLFMHMGSEFHRLSKICDIPLRQLSAMTYGEVAAHVGRLWRMGGQEDGQDGIGRKYTTRIMSAIKVLVSPLEKAAQGGLEESAGNPLDGRTSRDHTLASTSDPLDRFQLDLSAMGDGEEIERLLLLLDRLTLREFMESECLSSSATSPMTIGRWAHQVYKALSFPAQTYCETVSKILGRDNPLESALAFAGKEPDTYDGKPCLGTMRMISAFKPSNMSVLESSMDTRESRTYDLLFLLFIAPYALIYKEDESLKRFIAAWNQDVLTTDGAHRH